MLVFRIRKIPKLRLEIKIASEELIEGDAHCYGNNDCEISETVGVEVGEYAIVVKYHVNGTETIQRVEKVELSSDLIDYH